MPERVPVSVVIPTIGRPKLLRDCLESIVECDQHPDEVLIIDQSGGSEIAEVAEDFSELARIVTSLPPGLSRALNDGLAQARNPWLLVTHDDCTVDRAWIRTGAALAASARGPLIATGRVLPVGEPDRVPSIKTDPEPYDYTGQIRWDVLYPNNMVLPIKAVIDLGGFDEIMHSAAEDNDLCYRWLTAGHRLEYRPELTVFHHDWRTPEELERLYTRYWYGNGQFYGKHLRLGDLRMLRYLGRDAMGFVRATASKWLRGKPSGAPYATPMLRGLPRGLVNGWRRTKSRQHP